MALLGRQEPLGVERGHRARAGRGDRLAIRVVDDVARGEDAGDVRRRRAGLGDQVPRSVVVELVEEELGVRVVADGDEEALRGDLPGLVGR